MGDKTSIEWTRGSDGTQGATWNPVTGCDKVSAGCDNCYAETVAHRFAGTTAYPNGFALTLRPERLDQPLRWTRPRNIFVNSMSDLFHKDVPTDTIVEVWAVMAVASQHTYQVLTKRHARLRSLLSDTTFQAAVTARATELTATRRKAAQADPAPLVWPLSNVWVGVSAEDQHWADIRIPALLATPAAVRFVSAEPLLAPMRLHPTWTPAATGPDQPTLDWLIVGGESGNGARPLEADWVRDLREDATRGGVPFFFKQWGGRNAKANGRDLDGREWSERPDDVQAASAVTSA